jgi:lipid-A-disaccharide synthase
VRAELLRTLAGFAALPVQALDFALCRSALRQELAGLLHAPAPIDEPPEPAVRTDRPLEVFVSCAEASGELHACNLVRELRAEVARQGAPEPRIAGLGGSALAALGVETLGDPVSRAVMGIHGIRGALPFYLELLERCAAQFRERRPDVLVLVDSPALHVPLGRIAKRYGVRVLHFVTPQHWAWAPWRASKYAHAVDRALTILPFEPAWFERRGVAVAHVGHPLLDRLASTPATSAPLARRIAVLPGSRARVIDLNLPWMLRTLSALRERVEPFEAVILQSDEQHAERVAKHVAAEGASAWARHERGDLHESLSRSSLAFSVSGTVLLDVLHHRLPAVCLYRIRSTREVLLYRHGLSTPWFASPNLLAGREVVPEFCFRGEGPRDQVVRALAALLDDAAARREALRGLETAAARLGPPGACRRAALHALDLAAEPRT